MTRTAVLVTGGAGFIGSNLVQHLLAARPGWHVVVLDALTYAGNLENLRGAEGRPNYAFVKGDVAEPADVARAFDALPRGARAYVMHLAAESHVDRSIHSGLPFVRANVLGTQVLLDAAREHEVERFLHVSTDEVYGSLGPTGYFTETTPYDPSSPYSASKAGSDLLVRAAFRTHGFPVVITNCSNNYGPYQFPEKLIPLMIANAVAGEPLPVYGDGLNVRDWLYVVDHCEALLVALERGRPGETYNIGGNNERTNLSIVKAILAELGKPESLVRYVRDRPGHDRRYAIDASKIRTELGWTPRHTFETALPETVRWYLDHADWLEHVRSGAYRDYYALQYGS
ncbi:MAG TPA: dTDP-glucose 4,6-dehydratase [Planctomycetota bacterium]|nr:dTDP-glucose 4,6-dehydratase [Planctomycetota bacterium]